MSDHTNRRITQLRSLVQEGLQEENLDKLVQECSALAQDTPHVLLFFTLKSVFQEMSAALEGVPVDVSRHEELVDGITERVCALLETAKGGNHVGLGEIEELVRMHLVNLSLFQA